MKKLLFSAYDLDIGGIERALVTLVNKLEQLGYDITILLEKKQGVLLEELNKNVKIIEYTPSNNKNIFIRKIQNLNKRIGFILKYKNKFDFSACYATYSLVCSLTSRIASKNTALWVHSDYLTLTNNNFFEMIYFFKKRKYDKFEKIVFVSNIAKNNFLNVFPQISKKTIVISNLIDFSKIIKQSNQKIEYIKENDCTIFVNVGRHSETEKKLSRLIEASKMLAEENFNFKVLFVGDGPDNNMYKELVEKNKLEDKIIFLGAKKNPYPYFRIADCIILTSEYEGYPVVFLESFVLNKPIITTKVSDYEQVEKNYGYVAEKSTKDIYEKMKLFIEKGYKIERAFNPEDYNNDIINKLVNIIEGK